MTHWATKYIGKPYEVGARGPDLFDCWGLVWWVQKYEFGRELPSFPVPEDLCTPPTDPRWDNKVSDVKSRLVEWVPVPAPVEGDIVLMNRGHHVGVFLEADSGLILHTKQSLDPARTGIATAQPLFVLRKVYCCRDVQFYHYNGPSNSSR